MKTPYQVSILYKTIILFIALFCLSYLGGECRAQEKRLATKPNYHIGEEWVFKSFNSKTHKVNRVFSVKVIKIEDNKVYLKRKRIDKPEGDYVFTRKIKDDFIKFPIFKGKEWSSNIERKGKIVGKSDSKAVAWEKVTTQAGTCNAIKIQSYFTIPEGKFRQTIWHCPKFNNFIRLDYIDKHGAAFQTTELVKYNP